MYLYWAFQSSEEFSALDTSCMAISFFAGSSSPPAPAATGAASANSGGQGEARHDGGAEEGEQGATGRAYVGVGTGPP